jgi:hypothetical protein
LRINDQTTNGKNHVGSQNDCCRWLLFPAEQGRILRACLPAKEQGYRIIPVNPNLSEGLGETAVPTLTAIAEPVDLVLIFQRSENVPPFVDEAIEIGAKAVWMQLGIATKRPLPKRVPPG